MKVLNLYAGIGGNRRLWEDVEVTAIEKNPEIAKAYQTFFPNDKLIVTDAHQYLEKNFGDFDFIWSSPPCPSHSRVRKCFKKKPIYPNMELYEEILFLKHYYKGKYCVENVMPYYKPLIPGKQLDRHLFWTNYPLNEQRFRIERKHNMNLEEFERTLNVNVREMINHDKLKTVYRNCVDSQIGKFCLDMAFNIKQEVLCN